MACRTGCPTNNHETWGDCARSARIQIDKHGLKYGHLEKAKDSRLNKYRTAVENGVQPANTTDKAIKSAYENGGV